MLLLEYIEKKKILGCQNVELPSAIEFNFFGPKIYQGLGSINPKTHVCFFNSHPSLETFIFFLTKYGKIFQDMSNNAEKTSNKVAYFFKWKP